MAKDDLDQDLELEDEELEEEEEEEEEDSGEAEVDSEEESDEAADDAGDASTKKTLAKSEQRIRNLQSQNDKLTAELNKLRKASPTSDKDQAAKRDPEVERWMSVARDHARERLYEGEPKLKEYGLDIELIGGDTPEEMRTALRSLTRMVNRIETRVRNKVLREHGFSPEPKSSGAEPRRKIDTMSKEDFEKFYEEIARG